LWTSSKRPAICGAFFFRGDIMDYVLSPFTPNMMLQCAGKGLDLHQPRVMGILNVTPDSFSDGGSFFDQGQALEHALQMVEEGAAIIDIGGESTRPGSAEVSIADEIARVVPIIEHLAPRIPVPISIDTSKPEVMQAAVAAGAGMINDVYALRREGALAMAATLRVPVCLMHMQGEPRTMQQQPLYHDVVAEVHDFLVERISECESAGIAREQIVIDPGFGFGKSLAHNLSLLKHLALFTSLGVPLLAGMSRKSMIGAVLERPVAERLYGSIAVAVMAAQQGASIIRVHDVRPTVEALRMVLAVEGAD
jgi:dihydropteroate synthase